MTQNISDADLELLQDFIIESLDGLLEVDKQLVQLETDPSDSENINTIFRAVHSIKGNAGFFNLEGIKILAHRMETLLDEVREGKRAVTPELVSILLRGMDYMRALLQHLSNNPQGGELGEAEQAYLTQLEGMLGERTEGPASLDDFLKKLSPIVERMRAREAMLDMPIITELITLHDQYQVDQFKTKAKEAKAAEQETAEQQSVELNSEQIKESEVGSVKVAKKTMRIDEETIDGFMEYIGELIISSEVFTTLQKRIEESHIDTNIISEFKTANLQFNQLSQGLQKSLMEIRKVPLKTIFSKMPRLVRDISKSLDKKIEINLLGEETKIDKSLVETLEGPLVHMVRNSLDHGIEMPAVREAAGKPPMGTITLEGACDKTFFYLTIRDDGGGINPNKIKQAAIKKGLISQDQAAALSDKEALNLIFAPGFSSAEQVSQVSGRGVGMDVVLTNIKRANGSVEVDSTPGEGTSIIIKLPLSVTLIVISGLLIEVLGDRYIIPLENIREVANASESLLSTINGCSEVISFRDEVFPMVRLDSVLNGTACEKFNLDTQVMILVEKEGQKACLIANKLMGLQQIVLKNIGDEFKNVRMVSGGAILSDGCVGLVLDVQGLIEKTNHLQALEGQSDAHAMN